MERAGNSDFRPLRAVFERELASVKKQFSLLAAPQRRAIEKNVSGFKKRVSSMSLLLKKPKEFSRADEMLFAFEELPPFGKEYWFLDFISTEGGSQQQFVLTFGRSSGEVEVNRRVVRERGGNGGEKECMAIGWHYSRGKKVFAEGTQKVRATPAPSPGDENAITSSSKDFAFSISGNYPNYKMACADGAGREFFKASLTPPQKGETPFEFASMSQGIFGFQLVNLYFDFSGELEGKKFSGKCYFQKVLGVGPFVPWRWARCVFQNGSVMEFFEMTAPTPAFLPKKSLDSWYSFQKPGQKRETTYGKIKIDKIEPLPGRSARWVASSGDGRAFLEASAYAEHTFSFETKATGKFVYEEHFANARDFFFLEKSKSAAGAKAKGIAKPALQSLQKTGSGVCLFEDAYGFLL
ncbi:MAG: hypothetical protein WC792_06240 [Candidatus Micrarchaeia archaeon]|jgi:hypothetical protein